MTSDFQVVRQVGQAASDFSKQAYAVKYQIRIGRQQNQQVGQKYPKNHLTPYVNAPLVIYYVVSSVYLPTIILYDVTKSACRGSHRYRNKLSSNFDIFRHIDVSRTEIRHVVRVQPFQKASSISLDSDNLIIFHGWAMGPSLLRPNNHSHWL